MAMLRRRCLQCGKTCWHNSTGKGGKEEGWRCTSCAYPLGTGPKADRDRPLHLKQVAKALSEAR